MTRIMDETHGVTWEANGYWEGIQEQARRSFTNIRLDLYIGTPYWVVFG